MRKLLLVVSAIILLTCTSCSSPQLVPVQSAAANEPAVEVSSPPQATAAPDLCETSTTESIELLNAALDRIDRASPESEIDEASSVMDELFSQAGGNMGQYCGQAKAGSAVSELIVWASSSASTRPFSSASYAEGFLESICNLETELGVEFTPAAQIACAG